MKGSLTGDQPFPARVDERELVRAAFLQHCDLSRTGYVRVETDEDGQRVCVLYDARGYCLIASRYGQYPLIAYAIDRDITLATIQ